MWEDPIVAEVHRIREKCAAEFDFDVQTIFADLRKRQAALGSRLVPQKTEPNQKPKLGFPFRFFRVHVFRGGPGRLAVPLGRTSTRLLQMLVLTWLTLALPSALHANQDTIIQLKGTKLVG